MARTAASPPIARRRTPALITAAIALLSLWWTWRTPAPTAVIAAPLNASQSVASQKTEASAHYVGRAACATIPSVNSVVLGDAMSIFRHSLDTNHAVYILV